MIRVDNMLEEQVADTLRSIVRRAEAYLRIDEEDRLAGQGAEFQTHTRAAFAQLVLDELRRNDLI